MSMSLFQKVLTIAVLLQFFPFTLSGVHNKVSSRTRLQSR